MTQQVLTATVVPSVAAPASRRRIRARAVAAATVATSAIYLVASAAGADFQLTDPGKTQALHLTLPIIAAFTVYFAMLGWGTLALMERYTPRRARTAWRGPPPRSCSRTGRSSSSTRRWARRSRWRSSTRRSRWRWFRFCAAPVADDERVRIRPGDTNRRAG